MRKVWKETRGRGQSRMAIYNYRPFLLANFKVKEMKIMKNSPCLEMCDQHKGAGALAKEQYDYRPFISEVKKKAKK